MSLRTIIKVSLLFTFILSLSCSGSEYSQLIKKEMAKGVVYDTLLFNMKFGQTRREFFQKCWQLNQKGVISNGPGNKWVKYELTSKEGTSSGQNITMLFFGDFDENKIMTGMDYQFYYNAWSIWNKKLQSDKLIPVVMDSLKNWYPGNDFIKVALKNDSSEIFVKVDGNRRITIRPLDDDKIVKAKIDDLRYVLEKE